VTNEELNEMEHDLKLGLSLYEKEQLALIAEIRRLQAAAAAPPPVKRWNPWKAWKTR
jgi:hypothetical protein